MAAVYWFHGLAKFLEWPDLKHLFAAHLQQILSRVTSKWLDSMQLLVWQRSFSGCHEAVFCRGRRVKASMVARSEFRQGCLDH